MAKIKVHTTVTVIRANGDETVVSESTLTTLRDNPRFFAYDAHHIMFGMASLLVTQLEHRFGKSPVEELKHRKQD